jgi:hypothetical protein
LTGTSTPSGSASIPTNGLVDIGTPGSGVPSDPGSFSLAP